MTEEIRIAEEFVLLLTGAGKDPVKSDIHMQKEMFMLTKAKPKLQEVFHFKKHNFGPFSPLLRDILEEPMYYSESLNFIHNKITLSEDGKKMLKQLDDENKDSKNYKELKIALSLIRQIYDKLTSDEFMFLTYASYPEFLEKSSISDKYFKDQAMKRRLVTSMLRKKVITESRSKELLRIKG